jgi:hypothetical protein
MRKGSQMLRNIRAAGRSCQGTRHDRGKKYVVHSTQFPNEFFIPMGVEPLFNELYSTVVNMFSDDNSGVHEHRRRHGLSLLQMLLLPELLRDDRGRGLAQTGRDLLLQLALRPDPQRPRGRGPRHGRPEFRPGPALQTLHSAGPGLLAERARGVDRVPGAANGKEDGL